MSNLEPGAEPVVAGQLAEQLAALDRHLSSANLPGNLDGLFAHHILRGVRTSFTWEVNPITERWLEQNTDRLRNAPHLAVLGFGLTDFGHSPDFGARAQLVAGLRDLMRRDPFPADGATFVPDRRQLLGITLAASAVQDEVTNVRDWLLRILQDSRFRSEDTRTDLLRGHALGLLTSDATVLGNLAGTSDLAELALMHWMSAAGTARLADPAPDLQLIERRILTGLLRTDVADLSCCDAALLRAAAGRIIDASIDSTVLSRSHIGVVLRRFPAAMKRWRWDDPADVREPVQWAVHSEREVQDITWIMLRSVFDDLVDEEPLPRLGHSSYRADFGLPRLGVLIEIKYARSAADFKKIEKEILQDSAAYLRERTTYKKIIVFIYDASVSVQEHDLTATALLDIEHVIDVIIVPRPSQLPAPGAAIATPPGSAPRRPRTRRTTGSSTP